MTRPAIRAGLIGGAGGLVLSLLGLLPSLSCCMLILQWLLFVAVGGLAVSWLLPPRTSGAAAKEGALAGGIAGVIAGLVSMLLAPFSFAQQGGAEAILRQVPPDQLEALVEAGIDPAAFLSTGSLILFGAGCCVVTTFMAVMLGALGGLVFSAMRPDRSAY
jgi:hypothetical protein